MKVRVSTRMKGGRILPWNGAPLRAEGRFAAYMKDREGKATPALSVSGPNDLPPLFGACIISVDDDRLLLAGFECIDGAWLAQEWECCILSLQDDPPAQLPTAHRYRR